MAITVKNVLELPSLRAFRLAAGKDGLDNLVEKTGIVDYEFIDGFPIDEELAFEKNSFVISSLLFAKDDPPALLRAVKSLRRYGVSALGIKTIFYNELPEVVRKVADEEGFRVFYFDGAFFENVIADLWQAIQRDLLLGREAERLSLLYRGDLSPVDVKRIGYELHPTLRRQLKAYYCEGERSYSDWEFARILNGFSKNKERKQETAAFSFLRGFLFLVSADRAEERRFADQFSDAMNYAGLSLDDFTVGASGCHPMETGLHLAVREAVCAQRGGVLKETKRMKFSELGVLQILLWGEQDGVMWRYASQYLSPISDLAQEGNEELLNTAIIYVKTGGNISKTAKLLFVHENTVRYRMARVKERLDPQACGSEFFQNLAAAAWIMLARRRGFL